VALVANMSSSSSSAFTIAHADSSSQNQNPWPLHLKTMTLILHVLMFSICIKSKNPWSNSSWSSYPGGLSVKGTVGTHWSFDRFSTIFDMVTQETLLSYCEPWNMLFMLVWPWCWNRFTLSKNMQLKDIRYTKMKLKVDQLSKGFFFFFFPF
jgi:hypothetical protein